MTVLGDFVSYNAVTSSHWKTHCCGPNLTLLCSIRQSVSWANKTSWKKDPGTESDISWLPHGEGTDKTDEWWR